MNDRSIRNRLLEMEKQTPQLQERFEKEKRKMLERKLTRSGRVVWGLASLIGAWFFVYFSYVAITVQQGNWLVRAGFVVGAVFGAAWTVLGVSILRKGSFRLFRDENTVQSLTFGFTLLLLIVLLILGGQNADKTAGIQMMITGGIFFLAFGIPAVFNMRINRTESALREHLLKLELQIAEMAEKTKSEK